MQTSYGKILMVQLYYVHIHSHKNPQTDNFVQIKFATRSVRHKGASGCNPRPWLNA